MENKKVFYGDNGDQQFLDFIRTNYNFFKCVVVSTKQDKQNNINLLNSIYGIFNKHSFVELPSSALENKLVNKLIENEISDDVGLVIVIGNELVANFASTIFNNIAFVCTMPSINQLKTKANLIVYSYNRIINCTLHNFASCVGEIISVFSYVIEQVFNACVYKQDVNGGNLIKVENCLFNLSNMPLGIINSKFGKSYVCKVAFEVSKLLNDDFYSSSVINLAKNLCYNYSNISFGCALAYSSKVLFNAFNYVFNFKILNCNVGFNALKRLKQFDSCSNVSSEFIECNLNNFYNNITDLFNNYNAVKNDFGGVLNIYIKMFLKLYNKFLNLQFDKGFSHYIFLNPQKIISAFNKLPEQSMFANFVTFLREFGFLNYF